MKSKSKSTKAKPVHFAFTLVPDEEALKAVAPQPFSHAVEQYLMSLLTSAGVEMGAKLEAILELPEKPKGKFIVDPALAEKRWRANHARTKRVNAAQEKARAMKLKALKLRPIIGWKP